jgi:ribonuclease G
VLSVLKDKLSSDKAKYDILGISKFGLVEMTRERIHKTVQMLAFQACPYCQGRGKTRTAVTMSIYTLKELKRFLNEKHFKEISLTANNMVIEEILKNRENLSFLERKFRTKINLISNPSLHIEDIRIT